MQNDKKENQMRYTEAPSDTLRRRWLPALGTAVPLIILPIAVLSLPLAAAEEMRLSEAETASWILALYGIPGIPGLVLTIRYRQPLLLTGNFFVLIFIVSLSNRLSYQELIGASIVAGVCVVLLSALGLMERLAAWVPAPVVLGLLAGAVMPFVSDIFNFLGEAPVLIGGTVVAYFLSEPPYSWQPSASHPSGARSGPRYRCAHWTTGRDVRASIVTGSCCHRSRLFGAGYRYCHPGARHHNHASVESAFDGLLKE